MNAERLQEALRRLICGYDCSEIEIRELDSMIFAVSSFQEARVRKMPCVRPEQNGLIVYGDGIKFEIVIIEPMELRR